MSNFRKGFLLKERLKDDVSGESYDSTKGSNSTSNLMPKLLKMIDYKRKKIFDEIEMQSELSGDIHVDRETEELKKEFCNY